MDGVLLGLSAIGLGCWALCALANASVLFAQLRRRPDGLAPSFLPVVGAASGLIAWHASFDLLAMRFDWPAWLEAVGSVAIVMLDVGSGPYLLFFLFAMVGGRLARSEPEPATPEQQAQIDAAVGCLLGVAVADSIGLPMEGLSRRRLARWHPVIDRHRLLFGHGLCSDDTEHNVMVALSICQAGDDVERFSAQMRGRLRGWLLALPAGVGSATARAVLKLWLFLPRRWQGVYSAGNGAAMRAPLLGVLFSTQPETLRRFVSASTRLTHTDPKAECAALAAALAACEASQGRHDPASFLDLLRKESTSFGRDGDELCDLVERAARSADAGESSIAFAQTLGLGSGVSGYAYHTLPVALHGWFAHPRDYASAVAGVIACGGDTDTVAAITGGIVGAGVGRDGLPADWINGLIEWPASVRWLAALAEATQRRVLGLPGKPPREHAWLVLLGRNVVFLVIVLAHGFRRLLPPW